MLGRSFWREPLIHALCFSFCRLEGTGMGGMAGLMCALRQVLKA
jgi:hypothetical protein